jgi:CcmD family protein
MDGNYVAMAVTLIVWIGIFIFLLRLDKRVKKLER